MNLSTNINTRWTSIFVDELARSGLEAVCIAPGSRSTPLTLAFAACEGIRIYVHRDERSAGFFALGLAMASGRPVALVCTSGTAAANFHPAVIEAFYSHIPLLVLTADRPPELRGSGANQTIDQIKMFGDHVRWSVELPTPVTDAPDVVLRHLRTLAARAYDTANGLVKGPVHLNFPFRKPLEPDPSSASDSLQVETGSHSSKPYTTFSRGRLLPTTSEIEWLAEVMAANPRGLIICGPECPGGDLPLAVAALARSAGYPVLADTLSGVRHGPQTVGGYVLGGYDLWLRAMGDTLSTPDVVIRFGAVPTSSPLSDYLERAAAGIHVHIREDGVWADDLHLTHHYIQADPAAFCRALNKHRKTRSGSGWAQEFIDREHQTWKTMDSAMAQTPFFDGRAIRDVLAALPDDTIVLAGNSLPVRHIDTFDQPDGRPLTIFGNRGASGIDGNVSTALGLAAATGRRVVAFVGDITFYHDMNGLLAVRTNNLNGVTFIVTNNNGGGIFHRLPVAAHEPPFSELFLTPHDLTFEHAAALYGLRYSAVAGREELREAVATAFGERTGANLIEIMTDSTADLHHMRALWNVVSTTLKQKP